jgi:hypothetical protein
MQYKVLVAAFAASALAANTTTNVTNGTSTALPPISTANSAGQLANAGVLGAVVAGGIAFLL